MDNSEGSHQFLWYAMRDLTRPNAKLPAYKKLSESGFEVFTPLKERLTVKGDKRIREEVPIIHDLLFVHGDRESLDQIVSQSSTLQYRYKRGVQSTPITVSDGEMRRFIHAVRHTEHPRYYAPGELRSSMYGKAVRIVGGPFDGYSGKLLKLRGSRNKHLIVELPGLLSVAVSITPDYITFIY